MSRAIDCIVLGAGFVGLGAALALQARGRSVALVDRLGVAAGETSFGNTGIVQSEAAYPYTFPREPAEIVDAALNRDPRAHIRYAALPAIAPALVALFPRLRRRSRASAAAGLARAGRRGAVAEHRRLAAAAGAGALLREGGWIKVFRTRGRARRGDWREAEEARAFGVQLHAA